MLANIYQYSDARAKENVKSVLEDKIYDLSGKEVKVPKNGEVYIRNHKKFIQPGGNP